MANTRTVIGVFSSEDRAEKAVAELRHSGFSDNEISVVGPDRGKTRQQGDTGATMMHQHLGDGATWGAGIGGAAGLLASAGALAIPGFGPILALGPLAATLTGAAGGGLAGGLVDFGIPEQQSREYERKVKEGNFLAVLKTAGDADRAAKCLRDEGARDVRID